MPMVAIVRERVQGMSDANTKVCGDGSTIFKTFFLNTHWTEIIYRTVPFRREYTT